LRGVSGEKRRRVKELLEESFELATISNEVIEAYCHLYTKLKSRGLLIPDADLIIAATAIAHNMTLKTKDEHFKRLRDLGLKLEA